MRLHRLLTRAMDASLQEAFGRSLDDYDVIHQLRLADERLRMGELAARLLVANSSCHRIVGRLVDAGLVTRSPGLRDRRQVHVELTGDGRRLHRAMAAHHGRDIRRLFTDRLETGERAVLESALRRLVDDRPTAAE